MKKLLKSLQGYRQETPPIWLMRQAGRHLPEYLELRKKTETFLEFCYSPELAIEATLQPVKRYDLDAAILFSDILVIPDALGQEVNFIKGKGPKLMPIREMSDIHELSIEKIEDNLTPVFEAIAGVRAKLKSDKTLIGFSGAPWTLACYMVEGGGSKDFERTRIWAKTAPEEFNILIDLLTISISRYLVQKIKHGCDVIQIFDSWASVLDSEGFDKWVIRPTSKIIKNVREIYPDFPIIGFPRGAGVNYLRYHAETGVSGVSFDSGVPLTWIRDNIQANTTVQGNLDNTVLLAGGRQLDEQVSKIHKILGKGPFIFNLGHGVLPKTPIGNIERVINILRKKK